MSTSERIKQIKRIARYEKIPYGEAEKLWIERHAVKEQAIKEKDAGEESHLTKKDVVVSSTQGDVPVKHLQMAGWFVLKTGSIEAATAALSLLKVRQQAKKANPEG